MNPANSLKNTFPRSESWRKVLSISSSVNSEAWNLVMVPCPVANQCALTDKTVEHETRFVADIFGRGDFNHRLTITVETPSFLASFSGSTYPAASIAALSLRANGILVVLPLTVFRTEHPHSQEVGNKSFVSPVYEALPDTVPPGKGLTRHSAECARAGDFVFFHVKNFARKSTGNPTLINRKFT